MMRAKKEVLAALRHEFLDYAIGQLHEPYKYVSSNLIQIINVEAYRNKESPEVTIFKNPSRYPKPYPQTRVLK